MPDHLYRFVLNYFCLIVKQTILAEVYHARI